MEKLKLTPASEEECEKIYNKAIKLGYNFYEEKKPPYTVDVIFFDEDGDMTVQTGDPKLFVHPNLLDIYLKDIESYPEISGDAFLKK